jgi:SAM-dependent methyltransferase
MPASPTAPEEPYVLGTGDDELARLSLQHRLWSDAACDAWKRGGVGAGSRVLDVGCGPGFAAFDLAQLVTPSGRIVGIDESGPFIDYLNAQAGVRGLPQLSGVVRDVQKLPGLEGGPFDAAYARWVLCFTADPEAVVAGVASLLRPGGTFIVHDYFNYTSMTAAPRLASHDRLVSATARSFRARGGDPDVVGRLPAMMLRHGMDVLSIQVHQRLARGGTRTDGSVDPMLAWPLTWWRTFAPKLVVMGLLSRAECEEALADLAMIERDPARFIVCPPVYEVIAHRK